MTTFKIYFVAAVTAVADPHKQVFHFFFAISEMLDVSIENSTATDIVVYKLKFSTEANQMVLNMKWKFSTKQYTICAENSWQVILEHYLK